MGDPLQTGCKRNGQIYERNGKSDDSFSFSVNRGIRTAEMRSEEIIQNSFRNRQSRFSDHQGFKFSQMPSNLTRDAADVCLADDLFLNGQLIPFRCSSNGPRIQYYNMGDKFPGPLIHLQSPNPITLNSYTKISQSRDTSHTSRSSNRNFHYSQFPRDVGMHHLGNFSGPESTASPLRKSSSCSKEVNESIIQDATCKHMHKHSSAYVPAKLSRCSSFKWNVISLKPLDPVHARLDDSQARTRSLSASFSERSSSRASSFNGRPPRLRSSPNQRKSSCTLHHDPKKCNEWRENEHPKPNPELHDESQSGIQARKAEDNRKRNSKSKTSGYLHAVFVFKPFYEFLFWKVRKAEGENNRLISGQETTTSYCEQKRHRNALINGPACTSQKEEPQNNNAGIREAIEHCKHSHGGHIALLGSTTLMK